MQASLQLCTMLSMHALLACLHIDYAILRYVQMVKRQLTISMQLMLSTAHYPPSLVLNFVCQYIRHMGFLVTQYHLLSLVFLDIPIIANIQCNIYVHTISVLNGDVAVLVFYRLFGMNVEVTAGAACVTDNVMCTSESHLDYQIWCFPIVWFL